MLVHGIRRLVVAGSALACATVLTAPATSAQARPADLPAGATATTPGILSPADCENGVVGRFRKVGSGASFSYHGREVELQNESALDIYSRAEIKSGYHNGDQVWVDRSNKRYSLGDHGIKSNEDAQASGWVQCGPFSGKRTQSVNNSVHAARACARIDDVSTCGKWYLD